MIEKLRKKFVLVTMCAVMLVWIFFVGAINIYNLARINSRSNAVLEILAKNDGEFPKDVISAPNFGNGITLETSFETRYFTAFVNNDGQIQSLNMNRIAAISVEEAQDLVSNLYKKNKTHGMKNNYKYQAVQKPNGTLYIVLDCFGEMYTFQHFLLGSVFVSIVGLAVVFLLVLLLSDVALKPAVESYNKQRSFITNASHDIKTPLAIISAETELIEMDGGESDYTREIRSQVKRLASLTDKLVFLSRMEEKPQQVFSEFNFSDMLAEVLPPYEQSAQKDGFVFSSNLEAGLVYNGDKDLMCQACALLLDNCLKYTSSGGTISVDLHKSGKNIVMTVTNDVEEMTKGQHKELFDRFYRAEQSRNSEKYGNGIGLSVVQAIVTSHKGNVVARSDDGKTFTVEMTL